MTSEQAKNSSYPVILIPDGQLRLCPDLAVEIGADESIMLLQIDYLCQAARRDERRHNFQDGHWWTYQSVADWHKKYFKWLSQKTIARKLKELEEAGLIVTGNFNTLNIDRTIWYRPDYSSVARLKSITVEDYTPVSPVEDESIHLDNLSKWTSCPNGQIDQTIRTNCPNHVDSLSQPVPKTPNKDSKTKSPSTSTQLSQSTQLITSLKQKGLLLEGDAKFEQGFQRWAQKHGVTVEDVEGYYRWRRESSHHGDAEYPGQIMKAWPAFVDQCRAMGCKPCDYPEPPPRRSDRSKNGVTGQIMASGVVANKKNGLPKKEAYEQRIKYDENGVWTSPKVEDLDLDSF